MRAMACRSARGCTSDSDAASTSMSPPSLLARSEGAAPRAPAATAGTTSDDPRSNVVTLPSCPNRAAYLIQGTKHVGQRVSSACGGRGPGNLAADTQQTCGVCGGARRRGRGHRHCTTSHALRLEEGQVIASCHAAAGNACIAVTTASRRRALAGAASASPRPVTRPASVLPALARTGM